MEKKQPFHHYPYSPWMFSEINKWDCLTKGLRPVSFKKGAFIFQQQNYTDLLYIVKSGRVRITTFGLCGNERAIFIAEKGMPIGEESLLLGHVFITAAIAIVDTEVFLIPKQTLFAELARNEELRIDFYGTMAYKNMALTRHLEIMSFSSAYQRVAISLVNLMQRYGKPTSDGCLKINVRFTHSELADIVNTSRVTVNNIFTDLTAQGIIRKDGGRYVVCRADLLEEIAWEG